MQLRDYQKDLLNQVKQAYLNGCRSPCIVLGCGGGKTVLFAYMAKQAQLKGNTVWFLVHRQELKHQTLDTFKRFDIPLNTIHIDMVQTVSRNLTKYPPPDFIIFDECHFSKAKTWQRIVDTFPQAKLAGLTATPVRLDGKPLGDIYDCLVEGLNVRELIQRQFLAPYKYYSHGLIEVQNLSKRGADYDPEQSYQLLNQPKIYGDVIRHWETYAKDRQTIVYASTIQHSQEIAQTFQQHGVNAVHFDGNTPKKQRETIIKQFREGKITVVCNVDLISVGFDMPDCECCILLRPTQSTALHIQQVCRSLRPKKGKTAIILDHVGNYARHGLPDTVHQWTLDQKIRPASEYNSVGELVLKQCDQCFGCFESQVHKLCPYCGHVPALTRKELENKKNIELKEIKEAEELALKEKVKSYATADECQTVDELVEFKNQRQYSNGWVYYQQKQRGWL